MRIGEARNQTQLLSALQDARNYRLMMRRPHEVQWWNNIAMIAGDHHARYDPNKALFEDRDPNWTLAMSDKKARLVVNHSLSVARTELAKLSKSRPIMDVVANSNEPEDIGATKVASLPSTTPSGSSSFRSCVGRLGGGCSLQAWCDLLWVGLPER